MLRSPSRIAGRSVGFLRRRPRRRSRRGRRACARTCRSSRGRGCRRRPGCRNYGWRCRQRRPAACVERHGHVAGIVAAAHRHGVLLAEGQLRDDGDAVIALLADEGLMDVAELVEGLGRELLVRASWSPAGRGRRARARRGTPPTMPMRRRTELMFQLVTVSCTRGASGREEAGNWFGEREKSASRFRRLARAVAVVRACAGSRSRNSSDRAGGGCRGCRARPRSRSPADRSRSIASASLATRSKFSVIFEVPPSVERSSRRTDRMSPSMLAPVSVPSRARSMRSRTRNFSGVWPIE